MAALLHSKSLAVRRSSEIRADSEWWLSATLRIADAAAAA